MKSFLFPKGTVIPIIVFILALCHLSVIGSNHSNSHIGNTPPLGLNSVVLSDSSANLFWQSFNNPRETEWDLEIVRQGTPLSGIPTHFGITTGLGSNNPFMIDTLAQGIEYHYKVRAICGGVATNWSNETHSFFTHILNGSACGIDLEIPDVSCNNPTPYPIQVRNETGTSLGADVVLQEIQLIIEHDWLIDLELWLKSPSGQLVRLIDENGGTQNNFGDPSDPTCTQIMTLVNANACNEQPILGAGPPYTGRYFPLGNLNAFNDSANPNGIWELIICDDAATNVGRLRFVELVFDLVSCTAPTGLVATSIDSTSISLDWSPGGFCDSTFFEYGSPGFSPGNGIIVSATCPPYVLADLTGGSDYEIYIYENCPGGNSATSCSSIFVTTDCSSPPVTIASDFDNLQSCFGVACTNTCDINNYPWQNARNDELEWAVYRTGTLTSGTGPVSDASGNGKYIYMEVSSLGFFGIGNCSAGAEGVLLSNCMTIDTKNTDTCHVSFEYHMFGNSIGSLKFQITTDGINWINLWTQSGNQGNHWREIKLSLSPYDGMNAQFRFVGTKGNGSKGDIGLDNINFYGSIDNGTPSFTFYVDNDGDGFGSENGFVQNCFNFMPPGYVDNDLDCNDFNAAVSVGGQEIPCNGIDENCSGNLNGVNDDEFLPPPTVNSPISVCEGETFNLVATANYGGSIFWCDSFCLNGSFGDTLTINGLAAINGMPTIYHYYAYEEGFFCYSTDSAGVDVIVNPLPKISTQDQPVICQGEIFDLSTLQISDQNNTVGVALTYHSGFPVNSSNLISNLVSPNSTQDYYIRKIANGGCEDTTMVTITVLSSPTANIIPDRDTFKTCKGSSVFLTGYGTGGVPNYSQLWSTFETANSINVNSGAFNGEANLITYSVTGQNQCTDTDSIIILTKSSVDTVEILNINPVSFCFGNNGSISLNPKDGVPNYGYEWFGPLSSNGPTFTSGAYTIPNLIQGSYSITITDNSPEGCDFVLNNVIVDGPSATVLLDSIRPVSCNGASDGGVFLSVTGNNPTIAWSGGISSTSEDVIGLAAGTYSVTVTDSGCQTILSDIKIQQPDPVTALSNSKDVGCFGGNDGKIELSVFGGVPNYSFNWNNAPSVQNPSGLSAGNYYFTITDSQGCTFESDTISISEPTNLSVLVVQKLNPICFGEASGSIETSAIGGTPPYQYFWSDGGVGATRSGLAAGSFDVTVVDANNCENAQLAITIDNPPLLTVDTVQITNASCFGIADGVIDMTATGGTGAIGYIWNTGDRTQDLASLAGGDYVLTVIDGNSCKAISDTITINAPNNLNVNFDIISPFCVGTSDGGIDLEILSGGTSPYTFLWSDSTTNEDLANVPVGFYDVTITHDNGCISTFTKIKVDAPQVIEGESVESLSPICFGDSTGRIFSNILGGTRPYLYNWSNGLSSQNLQNLSSGFYGLKVTDANNCQLQIDSIEIIENDSLTVEILAVDQVLCHNDSTGGITVQASGGNPNYTYSWNGGAFSGANITGLSPGDYDLILTDSANCILEYPSIIINNPPEIDVTYQVSLDPDCTGGLNRDTIKLAATGGVGNLQFMWSDSTTGANLINIPAGEYEVTVTDDNDCEVVVDEIKVPTIASSFYFNNFSKDDVSCFGNEDGSICISFSGGMPPFQYSWSDGAGATGGGGLTNDSTICLANEEEGIYILTVVDSKGCEINSLPIEILEPNPIIGEIINVEHVRCANGSGGVISTLISGGNPPYDFAWIDTQTGDSIIFTQSANSFPAGDYVLRITDNIGCSWELPEPVRIFEPDSIYIDSIEINHVKCFEDSTGSVAFKIFGGTQPVNAFWGNGIDPTQLSIGTYDVTISDANGCVLPQTFTINGPTSGMTFDTVLSKNPICHDESTGEISFIITGGLLDYQYFINGVFTNNPVATDLAAGVHDILVMDANQCSITTSVTLNNPPELEINIYEKPVSMHIGDDGELTANVSGGVGNYQYLWSNDSTTQTITGLTAGPYFVTVTDGVGCQKEAFVDLDFTNSVNELEIDGAITLAPNPTNGLVRIDFELNAPENFQYFIINQEGKLIQKSKVDVPLRTSLEVDLATYSSGTYYFVLQKDNAWKSWKITKI